MKGLNWILKNKEKSGQMEEEIEREPAKEREG